jgi:hypothetical protein
MAQILNIPNSFVTFYNLSTGVGASEYVTDTVCGIQKDFCLPVFDVGDIIFQTQVVSTEVISSVTVYKIPPSGTGILLNNVGTNIITNGTQNGVPIYNIWFNFISSDLLDNTYDGDCFQLGFACGISEPSFFVSNQCFKKIADKCLTTRVQYFNNENAFGFVYRTFNIIPPPLPPVYVPTINAVRLPFYLKEPIVSSDKNVYVRSDGSRKLLSARLSKKYKALVDHVPEEVHQNLVVALNHDDVTFYPDNITNGIRVRFEDEYNNNFPEVMQNVSIWSADFTIFETPFNNFNSNCS